MRFPYQLPAILLGIAAIVVHPLVVAALEGTEINEIAKQTTILIRGQNPGSGVIIDKQVDTYYVLTAKHVVATADEYKIVTPDESEYPLNYSAVRSLPDVDLAVVQFTSPQSYQIAELGNSDTVTEGDPVYIAGWPTSGEAIPHVYQFITGHISGLSPRMLTGGYRLIYTNVTRIGMSGGPVFDSNGQLIGIHGQAEGREIYLPDYEADPLVERAGFSLGIPVNIFLQLALRMGFHLTGVSDRPIPSSPDRGRPTFFAESLRLVDASTPNDIERRPSHYYFTINLPEAAAKPLQQVTFEQILGVDYPRFSVRDSQAFEGTREDRGAELPLGLVVTDPPSRTVTVTFDPPVSPGRQITIALRATHNPRDGIYQYRVTAFPADGETAQGQTLGIGRFQFRKPEPF
jgi:hypothetical protein